MNWLNFHTPIIQFWHFATVDNTDSQQYDFIILRITILINTLVIIRLNDIPSR